MIVSQQCIATIQMDHFRFFLHFEDEVHII